MPVTRIGLSTYAFLWSLGSGAPPFGTAAPGMGLHRFADFAVDWGVDVAQFADNRPLDGLEQRERQDLVDRLRENGISIEIAVRGADRAHLLRNLELATSADATLLRTVLGSPGVPPISADEAIEALAPLREDFESAGVVLALENYDHMPTTEIARIARTLGPWAGICLDTVNSFGALEGPATTIDNLADLTVNLHVKDFEVVRAAHTMGFSVEGRPAGNGRLDVPALFARLVDRPPLTAVIELWTPPQGSLAATRDLEIEWARASVEHLRRLVPAARKEVVR